MPASDSAPMPFPQRFTHDLWRLFGFRSRALILSAVLVCFLIFHWLGATFAMPRHPAMGASLLWHAGAAASIGHLLLTIVGLILCVVVGTAIAGTVRFDAGFFAATLGLAALSIRAGTIGDVLRSQGASPSLFLLLALELILLYGVVALAWSVLWRLHGRGWLQADVFRDGIEDQVDPLAQKITATVAHLLIFFTSMSLFCRSDAKSQVMVAVFLSGFFASLGAHQMFPVQPSVWYWGSPLLAGLIGYLATFFAPGDWMIGRVEGFFSGLTRPLPLDYASAAPAGAILGYWISRRWFANRESEADETSAQ